jgi:uncharacterized protein (TIGR03437 family)
VCLSPSGRFSKEILLKELRSIYIVGTLLVAAISLHAQITVDKTSLTFSGQVGGPVVQQTVTVSTSAASPVFFLASATEQSSPQTAWLRFGGTCASGVIGTNGTTTQTLTIIADPSCIQAGSYTGSITLTPQPSGTAAVVIPVTFTVSAVGVTPASLQFAYQTGGTVPAPQILTLSGPSTSFTAAASTATGGNWLEVAPTNGAITGGAGTVTVVLDPNVTPTLAAGTYNGTVTITPSSLATNTPVNVPVTLVVTVPPPVTVSSNSIQLNYQVGGANNQPQQTLTMSTTSTQALSFGVSSTVANNPSGRNWIVVNPTSGSIPASGSAQVTVTYDTTAALPAGTYTGTLTLNTPGASPATQTINVSLLVSGSPLLTVPGAGLNFTYELNSGVTPAAQSVVASSTAVAAGSATGQMTVTATASATNGGTWLSVAPSTGTTGTATPFSVAVNPAGLIPGKYQGTVTFTGSGAGNGPQAVPVTLTVASDPSVLTNLTALTFASQIGQAAVATSQTSQTIEVVSSTGATLNYVATAATSPAGQTWLVLSGNTTGTTNNSFTVSVVPGSLAAGTYVGTVTITATNPATGNAAINSPVSIPVTFYVSSSPLLVVTLPGTPPSQPVFTAQVNGASPATQAVTLQSSNPAVPLTYTVAYTTVAGGSWLFATPLSGTTSPGGNIVNIGALPGILSAGVYTGTVTITATGPGGSAVADGTYTIPVGFQVTSSAMQLSQSTLQFSQTSGGSIPVAQTVTVTSSGQALSYLAVASTSSTVNWLTVSPTSGSTSGSGTLTISADGSKLSPGTYTGTVTVTSPNASNSPAVITVTLTVSAGTVAAAPASLTFAQAQGSATAPPPQTISVTSTPNSVNFTVTAATTTGGSWLTAGVVTTGATGTTGTGATPGSVQVTANAGTLAVGQYTGTVTITASGAAGSPITIPVTLNVVAPQTFTVTPSGTMAFAYVIGAAVPPAQQLQLTSTGATTFAAAAKTTDGATWLSVTPASGSAGTTATNLSVAVSPASLAAGSYTGTITITSPNLATPVVVNVTLSVTAIPQPAMVGIRNAASGMTGAISPGENITIFGTGIGPASLVTLQVGTNGKVSTNIGNTQVMFDGTVAAPVIYASATQTSVMVPYEIAGRATTSITVVYSGVSSAPLTYNVVPSVPGIYSQNLSGTGPGAILNSDGKTVNGPTTPAAAGLQVSVYMTGEGVTTPQAITGGVAPINSSGLETPVLGVTATVGGKAAKVTYAGSAPGIVYGVMQVNLEIPTGLTAGVQPLVISLGGTPTQSGLTVQVQ